MGPGVWVLGRLAGTSRLPLSGGWWAKCIMEVRNPAARPAARALQLWRACGNFSHSASRRAWCRKPRQCGFERGSGICAAWKPGTNHRSCQGRSWPGRPALWPRRRFFFLATCLRSARCPPRATLVPGARRPGKRGRGIEGAAKTAAARAFMLRFMAFSTHKWARHWQRSMLHACCHK